jgi:hypothetical protein
VRLMEFADLARSLSAVLDTSGKRKKFAVDCPAGCGGTLTVKDFGKDGPSLHCSAGCATEAIQAAIEKPKAETNGYHSNGHANGNGNGKIHLPAVDPTLWKYRMSHQVRDDYELALKETPEFVRGMSLDAAIESAVEALRAKILKPHNRPPVLNGTELDEELQTIARGALTPYFPSGELQPATDDRSVIIWEDHAAAVVANAEYLQRSEIVERLFYTQSISLGVGGKHQGKTTNSRTLAMSVMRGVEIWGRKTAQGHVIYAASDDEVATTRMQLLAMGWREGSDPLALVRIRPDAAADPDRVLSELAVGAQKYGTILIILDMLFDFARIRDEMSYAGTREAIGKIQTLADLTRAHVHSTHHSPKYMTDVATAATAALGSQGISARFSPIVLTRKFGDDLFTIESTQTRDPRGLALPQTCIELNEQGWAVSKGPFKNWMKWKMYAGRVMALFEGQESDTELSVVQISKDLDLPRPEVQNCLYHLTTDDGRLERRKIGRSFKYRLKNAGLFSATQDQPNERRNSPD